MRKSAFILTAITILGFSFGLAAQNITIGAKCGFSIPNLTKSGVETPLSAGYASRLGPDFAMYGEYHYSTAFSVTLGVEYSSQGGQKDKFQAFAPTGLLAAAALQMGVPYFYADFKSVAKMNYLIVPLLARYTWNLSSSVPLKVYASAGPFLGFLLNAHQVTSGSSVIYIDANHTMPLSQQSQPFDATTDIKDQLHSFNFGLSGFVGFSYNLTPKTSVFVEGGGNYGFITIQKDSANGKNNTGAGVVNLGYAYTF